MKDLDRIDYRLLGALQRNARLSNKELAKEVGLAESSCHARVRRLVETGVLKGFHAEVDPRAIGVALEVLVMVRLADHGEKRGMDTMNFLRGLPEVVQVFQIAGQVDLVLHVAVRDTDHLRSIVLDCIGKREEVADIDTRLVYERLRADGYPALSAPPDSGD